MKDGLLSGISILVCVMLIVYISEVQISAKPFSVKVYSPYLGLSILFFLLAMAFHSIHYRKESYMKGYKDGIQDSVEEIRKHKSI